MLPRVPSISRVFSEGRAVAAPSPESRERAEEKALHAERFYLGANLLTHLGGAARTEALFEQVESLAPALSAILHI